MPKAPTTQVTKAKATAVKAKAATTKAAATKAAATTKAKATATKAKANVAERSYAAAARLPADAAPRLQTRSQNAEMHPGAPDVSSSDDDEALAPKTPAPKRRARKPKQPVKSAEEVQRSVERVAEYEMQAAKEDLDESTPRAIATPATRPVVTFPLEQGRGRIRDISCSEDNDALAPKIPGPKRRGRIIDISCSEDDDALAPKTPAPKRRGGRQPKQPVELAEGGKQDVAACDSQSVDDNLLESVPRPVFTPGPSSKQFFSRLDNPTPSESGGNAENNAACVDGGFEMDVDGSPTEFVKESRALLKASKGKGKVSKGKGKDKVPVATGSAMEYETDLQPIVPPQKQA